MNTYKITNTTNSTIAFKDGYGNNTTIRDTTIISLDDSGYLTAINIFGQNNVVPYNQYSSQFVGSRSFSAMINLIRPANTTAYSAGQLISTATSGLTSLPAIATGIGASQNYSITGASIISSNGSASSKANFNLYLFPSASPAGLSFNDASAFNPSINVFNTSGLAMIGLLTQLYPNIGTATYGYSLNNLNIGGTTDAAGNVYAAIVLNSSYTPISGESFVLKINGLY